MNNQNSRPILDKEKTAGEKIFKDILSREPIKWTPEEEVRQLFIKKLIKEYKYPKSHIKKEVSIKSGQTETKKKADIVVFHNDKNFRPEENAYIIVECKKKDRKDGLDQLETYLSNTTAEYGVWFNGKDAPAYIEKTHKPHRYLSAPDIPPYGKTLADVGLYKKRDLVAAEDLKTVFEACHNYIYANEGYLKDKVFNEVVKLIFVKMIDEKSTSADCEFRITTKELREVEEGGGEEFQKRTEELFRRVVVAYPDIFGGEKILLKIHTLAYVVSQLQKYDFTKKTRAEIKGVAFQTFVHSHLRGERGEFFTPYPILKMAIEILAPKEHELILDPACGSGGFLVTALNFIRECFRKNRPDLNEFDITDAIRTYGNNFVFGIDFNPDLARVSKMYMVLNDDGHTGIFSENSLEDFSVISNTSSRKVLPEKFDIVVTNPPFGTRGKITRREILDHFDLGHKWVRDKEKNKWKMVPEKVLSQGNGKGGQVPDILFIERCLQFLKDGGRMAIVLPDGDLTNSSLSYIRQWIRDNARILAVVSLPPETFIPYGAGVKASVLFLQKLPKKELEVLKKKDHSIFMGIIEKIGYDIRGRNVYKRNEKGEILKKDGEPVVDEDVSLIIEEFRKFKEKYKLKF